MLIMRLAFSKQNHLLEGYSVDAKPNVKIGRRDLFRVVTAVTVAAAAVAVQPSPSSAGGAKENQDKRRAQYQANAVEVQTFYRVNRYPKK
jgi:hypothetical protein